MSLEKIKEELIELCYKIFESSKIDVELIEYLDFVDDLGMDSINFITLIVEIEGCFNITVPDDMLVIDKFKNIDEILRIVANQLIQNTDGKESECDEEIK